MIVLVMHYDIPDAQFLGGYSPVFLNKLLCRNKLPRKAYY